MPNLEAWLIFRENERYDEPHAGPTCWHCGQDCSGDVTESVDVDGMVGEVSICDEPDECPALNEAWSTALDVSRTPY